MNKHLFKCLGIFMFLTATISAQTINIPDPNFKATLIQLGVDSNNNGNIELSEAQNTAELKMSNKNITNLEGLQHFTNLNLLICSNNNIDHIPTEKLIKLKFLIAENNKVKTIDLRNCPIQSFKFKGNPLINAYLTGPSTFEYEGYYGISFDLNYIKYVCISSAQYGKQSNGVHHEFFWNQIKAKNALHIGSCQIQSAPGCPIVFIPDTNFKNAILPMYDLDKDGEICIDEAEKIDFLPIENKNITDLTGIESMHNLKVVSGSYNKIEKVDLSHNKKIRNVSLAFNKISKIDITGLTELTDLHIFNNRLTNIDTRSNTSLKSFFASNNQFGSLSFLYNKKLETIQCWDCNLNNIDVNGCSNLSAILLDNNNIKEINLSSNPKIKAIRLQNNKLQKLELTPNNKILETLLLSNNLLEEIDIRNCPSVSILSITQNPKLKKAYLTGNYKFSESFNSFKSGFRIGANPELNFICISDVPFINDIRNHVNMILGHYCTVTTICSMVINSFDNYFILSPNPASTKMRLTKKTTPTNIYLATIINTRTGQNVKTFHPIFGDGITINPIGDGGHELTPIGSENENQEPNSASVPIQDLGSGTYILQLKTPFGVLSKKFIKQL